MEIEQIQDDHQKKGRVRRKQTLNSILNQMHFYFSDSNLSKDRFLSQKLQESEYIDLEIFLKFNKLRKLTGAVEEIAKALKKSDLLELNEEGTQVKRKLPIQMKNNEDACTIYVQTLQPDADHEWLSNVFSEFGKVEYISIPKYAHNKLNKGFAFIEYENEDQVKVCLDYFDSIGNRISLLVDTEEIVSNKSYEEEKIIQNTNDNDNEGNKEEIEKNPEEVTGERKSEKRKLEEEEPDSKSKKQKVSCTSESEEIDEVKKKKRSSKRKAQIKELGLQVLTKLEWKKLRNRYWNMQRKKMMQLKQHLRKRKLHRSNYVDNKQNHNAGATAADSKEKDFIPGVIVHLKLTEPWTDAKKVKTDLKILNTNIEYVEVPVTLTSDEVYMRFANAETALDFCKNNPKGAATALAGDEEQMYWEKIRTNRDARLNKDAKKQRGRDKLLKRAEKELGKHIKFDDTED